MSTNKKQKGAEGAPVEVKHEDKHTEEAKHHGSGKAEAAAEHLGTALSPEEANAHIHKLFLRLQPRPRIARRIKATRRTKVH